MRLFTTEIKGSKKSETQASLKLRFYAAHVVTMGKSTGSGSFAVLSDALERRAEKIEMEGLVEEESSVIRVQWQIPGCWTS